MSDPQKLLFLSHAGVDSEAAFALAKRIEATPEAQKHGLKVWIDKKNLGGGRWKDQLQDGLARSTAFAVYVGSKGVVNWVWDEVSVALDKAHAEANYPLVPILANDVDIKAIPSFLSQFQFFSEVERDAEAFKGFLHAVLGLDARTEVDAEREPFVGLKAFDSSKAHLFFGRESETDQLIELIHEQHLVMVVGDSGSGKSSLVKAGLIPAFRGGRLGCTEQGPDQTIWHVIESRPGRNPFVRLADAVRETAQRSDASPTVTSELAELVRSKQATKVRDAILSGAPAQPDRATKILLVIDQFEEVRNSDDAETYVNMLIHLADPEEDAIRVVLTMRRDYYYFCSEFDQLYDRLEQNNRRARFHLNRIDTKRIADCITQPLLLAGMGETARTALASATIQDVGDEPGELALLQMALWRTWNCRNEHEGNLLEAYTSIGRVEGALARAAEDVFQNRLCDEERARSESLFIRLVRPGENGGATRRVAHKSELDNDQWALAIKLSEIDQERLLTLGENTIEITHESLATQWARYQGWINNRSNDLRGDDLRILQALIIVAQKWQEAIQGHKEGHLARGYTLGSYEELAERREQWLSSSEQTYISSSQAARSEEEERKRKTARNLKWLSAASVILVILLGSSALWAFFKQKEATDLAGILTISLEKERQALIKERKAREYADRQRIRAENAEEVASSEAKKAKEHAANANVLRDRALRNHSRFLAKLSTEQTINGNATNGILLSLEALSVKSRKFEQPVTPEASGSLYQAIVSLREKVIISSNMTTFDSVNYSPDGKVLASGGIDGKIHLWDVDTGDLLSTIETGQPVRSVSFSPNGKTLATNGKHGTIRLWNVDTGKPINANGSLRIGKGVRSLSFSPDNKTLASGSKDGKINFWDAASGDFINTLDSHSDTVLSVKYSPDGETLASSGGQDGMILIWDATTHKPIVALKGHKGRVGSVSYSPNGEILASGGADGTIRLWDIGKAKLIATMKSPPKVVFSVSFSPDGQTLASAGSRDGTIRLWDVDTGNLINTLRGHDGSIYEVSFSPDGQTLVSRGDDMRVWLTDSQFAVHTLEGHNGPVSAISFSPDGRALASGSFDETVVHLWNVDTGDLIKTLRGHPNGVRSLCYSPDGKILASGSGMVSRDPLASDSSVISEYGTVRLWDVATGSLINTLNGHNGQIYSLSFSPDNKTLASGSEDGTIRFWDATTGDLIKTLNGHSHWVHSVTYSPNGTILASGSADGTIRLWDIETGDLIRILTGYDGWIYSLSFNHDGSKLASSGSEGKIDIWETNTGRLIRSIEGIEGEVYVSYSPDGKSLVSSSHYRDEGKIHFWQGNTGDITNVLESGPAMTVRFSPDSRNVASGNFNGTIRIWPAFGTPRQMVELAKALVPRQLTADQRKIFLID